MSGAENLALQLCHNLQSWRANKYAAKSAYFALFETCDIYGIGWSEDPSF